MCSSCWTYIYHRLRVQKWEWSQVIFPAASYSNSHYLWCGKYTKYSVYIATSGRSHMDLNWAFDKALKHCNGICVWIQLILYLVYKQEITSEVQGEGQKLVQGTSFKCRRFGKHFTRCNINSLKCSSKIKSQGTNKSQPWDTLRRDLEKSCYKTVFRTPRNKSIHPFLLEKSWGGK